MPGSGKRLRALKQGSFEGLKADATEMGMVPRLVIEHFGVIKDIGTSKGACLVDSLFGALLFQAAKERLYNSVVPTVATTIDADYNFMQVLVKNKTL